MKKIIVFALVMCMALSFVSCGEKNLTKNVKLGQYKGLEVTDEAVTVTDSDLQSAIEQALANNAKAEEVTDRGVQNGDTATIDFAGYIDGKEFEGGTYNDYKLEVGTANMIDGFVEGIIGVKTGEKVSLDLKFPDNYQNADVAGKPVKFDITVKKIEVSVTPEYNDEFCKTLGYDTKAQYEESLKADLLQEKTSTAESKKMTEVWTKIVDGSEVTKYPKDLVDDYLNDAKAELQGYAEMFSISFEELLTTYYGITEEEYNETILEEAKGYVKEKLVILAIAEAEGLQVTEEEYAVELKKYADANDQTPSDFEAVYGREVIEESILWERVVNFALENAVIK